MPNRVKTGLHTKKIKFPQMSLYFELLLMNALRNFSYTLLLLIIVGIKTLVH